MSQNTLRYSPSFKQKVIEEIERGELTMHQAREKYQIGGGSTIRSWIKKYGRNHILGKVVRIESVDDLGKVKQMEKELKEAKEAIANCYIKILFLEGLVDLAKEEYGIDLKKKEDTK